MHNIPVNLMFEKLNFLSKVIFTFVNLHKLQLNQEQNYFAVLRKIKQVHFPLIVKIKTKT